MKANLIIKNCLFLIFASFCMVVNAQHQTSKTLQKGYFINPIFGGDNPDPSVLRDGDDFYLVHSSFEYYPGLLIWHSTDLINWQPVTNALNTYVGSVWAPDLVKYNNKYYIYFPANDTNYVITADNIAGPWSAPVDLKIGNIDPGHVVDEKGNRYLYFSNGGYVPLAKDGLSVTGGLTHSYDGWAIPNDWSIECFCMEGPKLFKRGAYYYLTVAEGGTAGPATGHMVVSARAKSPLGPWETSPYNPIVRAETNTEKWASVGHGTIFDDAKGNWWMIFHGYENDHYNMGRQTLLLPIEWTKDGWYKIPDNVSLEKPVKVPDLPTTKDTYTLSDTFEGTTLKPTWKFFKEYNKDRFTVKNNELRIQGKGGAIANSSPLLCTPTDHSYIADVELEIEGDAIGGLVLFYNEQASSGILADSKDVLANLRGWQFATKKDVIKKRHVFLRLINKNNTVDMYYSNNGKNWNKIENSLEVSGLHHNVLSGFLSLKLGLCAMGNGTVVFKNFTYTSL